MFEGIVNSLLEKYLAPYLDNMSAATRRNLQKKKQHVFHLMSSFFFSRFVPSKSIYITRGPVQSPIAESNLRFRLGKMSAKNLKLKSSLCALLGFDALELKVGIEFVGVSWSVDWHDEYDEYDETCSRNQVFFSNLRH